MVYSPQTTKMDKKIVTNLVDEVLFIGINRLTKQMVYRINFDNLPLNLKTMGKLLAVLGQAEENKKSDKRITVAKLN